MRLPRKIIQTGCAALAFGLIVSAGCGVKSAPIPREQVLPQPIADLHVSPDPNGIKVIWKRPTVYTSGHSMRDLGSFVIMRADGDGPLAPLIELPVTDRERFAVQREFSYIDGETAVGQRYRYQILSKTTDGYVSPPSNEVEAARVKPSPTPNPDNFKLPTPQPLGGPGT